MERNGSAQRKATRVKEKYTTAEGKRRTRRRRRKVKQPSVNKGVKREWMFVRGPVIPDEKEPSGSQRGANFLPPSTRLAPRKKCFGRCRITSGLSRSKNPLSRPFRSFQRARYGPLRPEIAFHCTVSPLSYDSPLLSLFPPFARSPFPPSSLET